MMAGWSGLAGLETADLAVGDGEGPFRAHLAPGVVAVGGDQRPAAVLRRDHVEVAVHGEDLPVGPADQVAVGAVVGHRRVRGQRGEERLAVPGVDGGDQGLDGGFGDVVGSHGSMMPGPGGDRAGPGRAQANRAIWRILFIASSAATLYASASVG